MLSIPNHMREILMQFLLPIHTATNRQILSVLHGGLLSVWHEARDFYYALVEELFYNRANVLFPIEPFFFCYFFSILLLLLAANTPLDRCHNRSSPASQRECKSHLAYAQSKDRHECCCGGTRGEKTLSRALLQAAPPTLRGHVSPLPPSKCCFSYCLPQIVIFEKSFASSVCFFFVCKLNCRSRKGK